MTATLPTEPEINRIMESVRRQDGVRRPLPGGGVLAVDRGLPYLLVHRPSPARADEGTARLVSGEASLLLAGPEPESAALAARLAEAGAAAYGAFALLEVWSAEDPASTRWVVHGPDGPAGETMEALAEGLRGLADLHPGLEVEVRTRGERAPPGLPPLLSVHRSWQTGILLLGLEVPPVFRDAATGRVFPRFVRRLQRRLSRVLRQALHEFIRVQTSCEVDNPRALGTRTVPDAVWRADRELADIERGFEILLLTSPVNEREAWQRFRDDGYERDPAFHYRLLPLDPDLLKRRLFQVPLDEVDDPALAALLQDKRQELETQLTMLDERGSAAFRYSSMRLYGAVDDALLATAEELLARVPPSEPRAGGDGEAHWVDAQGFRAAAEAEVAEYAAQEPAIAERSIEIRPDVVGLMVSEGNLLIGEALRLSPARVPALLHHEVGTHVLTWVNGHAQPLEQMSLGLAGYDELQEGLAVLAEYLVGGLDRSRMRLLAARVVAAHSVEGGAPFVETFRLLTRVHGLAPRSAWHVAARVHGCGGFTRDLIYLRGLVRLLDHLRGGGALEPLYVGKIAQRHLPVVEELRHRGVLREPPLLPRVLRHPDAARRLEAVRQGIPLVELIAPEDE